MVLRLVRSGLGFVGVAAEVLAMVLEEVVPRVVFVRVLDLVLSFQTDFLPGGTTRVCDLQRVSFLVVLLVVLEQ